MDLTPDHPRILQIMARLIPLENGCMVWPGAVVRPSDKSKTTPGYPSTSFRGKGWRGHRLVFTAYHGPVPDGLEVDHTCANTLCMNPDHLDAVTGAENARRRAARVKQCPAGHEYTPGNTMWTRRKTGRGAGGLTKHCRVCQQANSKDQYARRKAAQSAA